MKSPSFAPDIPRQRLLIEGFYELESVDEQTIRSYFDTLTTALNLRTYGDPIIFCPESLGKEENQGYDAFVPLIDSGISLYVWTQKRFVSLIIYTCKAFEEEAALATTHAFSQLAEHQNHSF